MVNSKCAFAGGALWQNRSYAEASGAKERAEFATHGPQAVAEHTQD